MVGVVAVSGGDPGLGSDVGHAGVVFGRCAAAVGWGADLPADRQPEDGDGGSGGRGAGPASGQRRTWAGRQASTPPRRAFRAGYSQHKTEVLRFATSEEVLFVDDLYYHAPPHFVHSNDRSYHSFIAVPIRAGETSFGMLTVDSDLPGSLTEADKGHIILLAGVSPPASPTRHTARPRSPHHPPRRTKDAHPNPAGTPSAIQTSPLLSDEDRQFLAGHLGADCFLETARRRAAAQTRHELGRYTCTATLAALTTVAFITTGTSLFPLTTTAAVTGTAISLSGIAVILCPWLYHHRRRQAETPR